MEEISSSCNTRGPIQKYIDVWSCSSENEDYCLCCRSFKIQMTEISSTSDIETTSKTRTEKRNFNSQTITTSNWRLTLIDYSGLTILYWNEYMRMQQYGTLHGPVTMYESVNKMQHDLSDTDHWSSLDISNYHCMCLQIWLEANRKRRRNVVIK